MAKHRCLTCGNSYTGWECPVCSKDHQAEELPPQAVRQQEISIDAPEPVATQQREQARGREEELPRPKATIEDAQSAAQVAATEAAQQRGQVTAHEWKVQPQGKSEDASSHRQSGPSAEGNRRLDEFRQKLGMGLREEIESYIPVINQLCEQGELSRETTAQVMGSVHEKYTEWKPSLERQLLEATLTSAGNQKIAGHGGIWIVVSLIVLTVVAVLYSLASGITFEKAGAVYLGGTAFGAILVGALSGRLEKRVRGDREAKSRISGAFAEQNKIYANLGLPLLTPQFPMPARSGPEGALYAGIILCYLVTWHAAIQGLAEPAARIVPSRGAQSTSIPAVMGEAPVPRAHPRSIPAAKGQSAVPPGQPVTIPEDIGQFLQTWGDSFRTGNFDVQMACYAPFVETYYRKHNLTRAEVRREREGMIAQYGAVRQFDVSNVEFMSSAPGRMEIKFKTHWELSGRGHFAGEDIEKLTLVQSEGRWLITSEEEPHVYWTKH